MPPSNVLPVSDRFTHSSPDEYITALLAFADDPFLRTLCGGIHILDFFTRDSDADPKDIYRTVLPADWIAFFALLPIDSILDLLMRTPLAELSPDVPPTLRTYIESVRAHTLDRTFQRRAISEETKNTTGKGTEWALNAGMKPKKIHEVCAVVPALSSLANKLHSDRARFFSCVCFLRVPACR